MSRAARGRCRIGPALRGEAYRLDAKRAPKEAIRPWEQAYRLLTYSARLLILGSNTYITVCYPVVTDNQCLESLQNGYDTRCPVILVAVNA